MYPPSVVDFDLVLPRRTPSRQCATRVWANQYRSRIHGHRWMQTSPPRSIPWQLQR